MAKYDPLVKFFKGATGTSITLRLREIERIIGDTLPPSAKGNGAWWGNEAMKTTRHTWSKAWVGHGWSASPDLPNERVTFTRLRRSR